MTRNKYWMFNNMTPSELILWNNMAPSQGSACHCFGFGQTLQPCLNYSLISQGRTRVNTCIHAVMRRESVWIFLKSWALSTSLHCLMPSATARTCCMTLDLCSERLLGCSSVQTAKMLLSCLDNDLHFLKHYSGLSPHWHAVPINIITQLSEVGFLLLL